MNSRFGQVEIEAPFLQALLPQGTRYFEHIVEDFPPFGADPPLTFVQTDPFRAIEMILNLLVCQ